ncbi:MAG: regulatory signaling modulator protein AmpE [Dokdonella sp.]
MATTLLAVVLALAACYALPDLRRLRDFGWLQHWLASWTEDGGSRPRGFPMVIVALIVVVVCLLVQGMIRHTMFGLPAFAFAVAVLYYSLGPRDLEQDIDAVLKGSDEATRLAAAQNLRPNEQTDPLPLESSALVEATFLSALSRIFGVVFWFVVLGPAGALGYRVIQLMARAPLIRDEMSADDRNLSERVARILDWAPAHLLTLAMALASDFDRVMKAWRAYHEAHGQGWFTLDLGFLPVAARSGVDGDVIAGDGYATDVSDPLGELADARALLHRILVIWLVAIAVLALSGWTY